MKSSKCNKNYIVYRWSYHENIHRWLRARLQYLQCVSNGDTAVLHKAVDMEHYGFVYQHAPVEEHCKPPVKNR